jgi:hypothetical protein
MSWMSWMLWMLWMSIRLAPSSMSSKWSKSLKWLKWLLLSRLSRLSMWLAQSLAGLPQVGRAAGSPQSRTDPAGQQTVLPLDESLSLRVTLSFRPRGATLLGLPPLPPGTQRREEALTLRPLGAGASCHRTARRARLSSGRGLPDVSPPVGPYRRPVAARPVPGP